MDEYEGFTSKKGGIKNYVDNLKFMTYRGKHMGSRTFRIIYWRHKTDILYFCTFNLLIAITSSGVTEFGAITQSDYRAIFIDRSYNILLNNIFYYIPSLFDRKLRSKCPRSTKAYKNNLEKLINQHQIVIKVYELRKIVDMRKLTNKERKQLNEMNSQITSLILYAEKKQ